MNKKIVVGVSSLAAVVAFIGIGLCADNFQLKQDPKKVQTPPKVETPAIPKAPSPAVSKVAMPARPEETSAKNAQLKPSGIAAMSKDEMITDIKDALESEDEILNATPGLKAEKDAKGNVFYTYKGTKIEDLSKEELDSLAVKVHQARTRLNTERIQRQLEITRRVERLQRVTAAPPQPPRIPAAPPSAARTSAPPSAPRTPPSAPPAPPRR